MTRLRPRGTTKKRRISTATAKKLVKDYLVRRSIRTPKLALPTPSIARAVGLSSEKTWQTLDRMYDEDTVDRWPTLEEKPTKYLRDSITGKAYFPVKPAQHALQSRVSRLVQLAITSPIILTILGCTIDDIRRLSDLNDLEQYNIYVIALQHNGIATLPLLQWRTKAIRWWLIK